MYRKNPEDHLSYHMQSGDVTIEIRIEHANLYLGGMFIPIQDYEDPFSFIR